VGGAEVKGMAGGKAGGWASSDEMVGVVGVDEMDKVVVEITDEVEDEVGQTDEPTDMEGEDTSEDDRVTMVSKGGGAGTMHGNRDCIEVQVMQTETRRHWLRGTKRGSHLVGGTQTGRLGSCLECLGTGSAG